IHDGGAAGDEQNLRQNTTWAESRVAIEKMVSRLASREQCCV
ncbi:hypothetical protein A2U01_0071352, partial [Trifolium medium]|nr:hypothetical protein [Trifolium medium]